MSSLMSGDAISDASSRLALQGGAVAAWSRGCLVVATWLRLEPVIVDQTFDCGMADWLFCCQRVARIIRLAHGVFCRYERICKTCVVCRGPFG